MVSSYLVHHGYCSTATAFARVTDTAIQEEQTSIKNRQSKSLGQVFPKRGTLAPCYLQGSAEKMKCYGSRGIIPRQHEAVHSALLS